MASDVSCCAPTRSTDGLGGGEAGGCHCGPGHAGLDAAGHADAGHAHDAHNHAGHTHDHDDRAAHGHAGHDTAGHGTGVHDQAPAVGGDAGPRHTIPQASIPAQTFAMGDSLGDGKRGDGETPVHPVRLAAFDIDTTSVTNADFARFVDATGYETEAERFGYSAVFHLALAADEGDVVGQPPSTPWWLGVRGADWRHPEGPLSNVEGLGDHPVVHVSWNDAVAYCEWAGRALPTEAQWEAASRGGAEGERYPWGDDLGTHDGQGGEWRVNIWQGSFPMVNTVEDGFLTTAPVHTFEPNAYGLWQTVGNVWEWCADVFREDTYARAAADTDRTGAPAIDPAGPDPDGDASPRVMRGGSFLCHDSYCNRYRNAARSSNTPDSSMANAGFRTVSLG